MPLTEERKLERTWINNFQNCPLVDKASRTFDSDLAFQIFYGGRQEAGCLAKLPQNFKAFYQDYGRMAKQEVIDRLLTFLHLVGITITKRKLVSFLDDNETDYPRLMNSCFAIFRMLAHYREKLDITSPYQDNYGDIHFLLRIETGGDQITLFENTGVELKVYYRNFKSVPLNYEKDKEVKALFEHIENSRDCFFLTGKAGTGKSTFIHYLAKNTEKQVLLCAFTGIAAVNIGGQTLHSIFKFPIKPLLPEDREIEIFHKNSLRRKMIERVDTIVIDEVSMLRSDLLEAIDYSLRHNGGDVKQPFGGKQLILVGDIFQLPPVVGNWNEMHRTLFSEVYKSEYFFDAPIYKTVHPFFKELTKVHRQKDRQFIEILDNIRTCRAEDRELDSINKRYDPQYVPAAKEFIITLTTTNYIANNENNKKLNELNYTPFDFEAIIKGEFSNGKYPTDIRLRLKKHAQVIFVKNDLSGRWVNGTIGKVEFVSDDLIEVKLQDGSIHSVVKETWENRKYKYDRKKREIVSEVVGTFTQYPLKLAWAITIHKSQGLTFDKVAIDLGTGAFVNGQLYTALSRCRSLEGIVLKRKVQKEDIIEDKRLIKFYEVERLLSKFSR